MVLIKLGNKEHLIAPFGTHELMSVLIHAQFISIHG